MPGFVPAIFWHAGDRVRCPAICSVPWRRSRPRHHAAGHRLRHAGGRGIGQRQAVQRAHRQKGEGLRLQMVARPADPLGGLDASPAPAARPACASASGCGRRRRRRSSFSAAACRCGTMRATAAAVKAVSVAAPSSTLSGRARHGPWPPTLKALRSSDFGGGSVKKCMPSSRRTTSSSTCAGRRQRAVLVHRRAGARRRRNRRSAHCRGRCRRRSGRPRRR